MLLIAQRVTGPGGDGYNAYCHLHGPATHWVWELPEGVPDRNPGQQANSLLTIRGPGRVRSFLDLAFPDEGSLHEVLRWAHDSIIGLINVGSRLPLSVSSGPWFARFEVERGLIGEWHDELHRLGDHIRAVRQSTIWVRAGQVVQHAGIYRCLSFDSPTSDPARQNNRVQLSKGVLGPVTRNAEEAAVWVLESTS
jgi:hypothetical protein